MATFTSCAFLLLLALLAVNSASAAYKRVCYYTNWAQYRPGSAKFLPSNIDTSLCSHIIYAFASMQGNALKAYEWNDESTEWSTGMYKRVTDLKKRAPSLKILLAVGGWNFGTTKMTAMIATAQKRKSFTSSTIKFLRTRNFDGIDVDFEYPGSRGSPASDIERFTLLLKEMRRQFNVEGRNSGKGTLLLTAAVPAGSKYAKGYEVSKVCKELDFVNLMAYDLNGSWSPYTGINAPLFSRPNEKGSEKAQFNVEWAANYWVGKGCPRSKLIIGMPMYARTFELVNANKNGLGAPTKGPASPGPSTREAGFYSYYEVCTFLKQGARHVWSNAHKSNYAYKGTTWLGYDNPQSLTNKVNWLVSKGYGGWMMWSLDLDDFTGQNCKQGKYPLLRALNSAIKSKPPPNVQQGGGNIVTVPTIPPKFTTTTRRTTTRRTTTRKPATAPPATKPAAGGKKSKKCAKKGDGFHQLRKNCARFFRCVNGVRYNFSCKSGLIFDPDQNACNYRTAVRKKFLRKCKFNVWRKY